MAVIRCPHCGELISSNVPCCTECGKELKLNLRNEDEAPSATKRPEAYENENEDENKDETPSATKRPEDYEDENEDETPSATKRPEAYENDNDNENEDQDIEVNEVVEVKEDVKVPECEAEDEEEVSSAEDAEDVDEAEVAGETEGEEPVENGKPEVITTALLDEQAAKSQKWYHLSARRIVVLCFLAPFVIGFFVLIYNDIRKAKELEERAFARLENCTNLLFYEDFLVRFPESEHAAEVKTRYEAMKAEHEMFFREAANGTREQLKAFIEQHPTSPYRKACEMRVDSLDWNDAKEDNTLEGYHKYLALHPDGLFLSDAQDARNRQLRLVVTPEETSILRGALDNFLSAMTAGDAARINQLTGQSFTFCGQSGSTGENVVEYYHQNLHKEDVMGVHFQLGGASINKRSVQGSDAMSYSLYSTATATFNRSSLDSVNVVNYKVSANFSPERRITSVSVSQVVPVETPASAESTVVEQ